MEEEPFDGDADGKLLSGQLLVAEQVAAARSAGAIRISNVIEQIIALDDLERFLSPPAQIPEPLTPQRAGPS